MTMMSHHARSSRARQLLFVVVALNLLGIACFSVTTRTYDPLATHGLDYATDPSSVLDAVGFTLMLPGIFFATIVFLCARVFAWGDQAAFAVWYAAGFAINIVAAWKAGGALDSANGTRDGRRISEELL